jgi:hypothetical protein
MNLFDDVKKKAQELTEQHPDQVEKVSDTVIDKVGDFVDERTGHKHSEQIDKAQATLDDKIGD